MIETEREYVKSLNYIIKVKRHNCHSLSLLNFTFQHYLPEMERNDIPATLRGHRHGLIFDFESFDSSGHFYRFYFYNSIQF